MIGLRLRCAQSLVAGQVAHVVGCRAATQGELAQPAARMNTLHHFAERGKTFRAFSDVWSILFESADAEAAAISIRARPNSWRAIKPPLRATALIAAASASALSKRDDHTPFCRAATCTTNFLGKRNQARCNQSKTKKSRILNLNRGNTFITINDIWIFFFLHPSFHVLRTHGILVTPARSFSTQTH